MRPPALSKAPRLTAPPLPPANVVEEFRVKFQLPPWAEIEAEPLRSILPPSPLFPCSLSMVVSAVRIISHPIVIFALSEYMVPARDKDEGGVAITPPLYVWVPPVCPRVSVPVLLKVTRLVIVSPLPRRLTL